ncbi:hypothetical protein [Streptomyces sp. NPDC127038]|uniref:hypothetical protein n=1 Tax=Streptomyces sp. NPDC127038 TaxID=3347114 RepID=UPI00365AAB92
MFTAYDRTHAQLTRTDATLAVAAVPGTVPHGHAENPVHPDPCHELARGHAPSA